MDGAGHSISRRTAEFADAALEQAFRARNAPVLARQAATAILLGAALTVAFAVHDWVVLGPVPFHWLLLTGRVVLVLAAVPCALGLLRHPARATGGRTVTALSAGLAGLTVGMLLVLPAPLHWHAMMMGVILLAITLAVPNRFVHVAWLALASTAVFVGAALWTVRPSLALLTEVLLLLGSANTAGLLAAHRLSGLRRAEFAQVLRLEAANAQLSREVAERTRLEGELLRLATTDGLTGLLNRRHFLELSDRELARARRSRTPLALCVLDVDRFKAINDAHGHAVGDTVLQAVASACLAAVREVDVVGRFGGEEFTLCLPDTDLDAAAQVGERLRRAIADLRLPVAGGGVVALTATVGVATCAWTEQGVAPALHRADMALYEGKRGGRDRVVTAVPPAA